MPQDQRANQISSLLNKLGRKEWVVHFCERYENADDAAKYLASYVKGGTFSNRQIQRVREGRVKFRYKCHASQSSKTVDLSVRDFVLRVVDHVLPPRKTGVRYGGLYSSSGRKDLERARKALGQSEVEDKKVVVVAEFMERLGRKLACRHCQGAIVRREELVIRLSA